MELSIDTLIILFLSGAGILICLISGIAILFRSEGSLISNRLLGALLILASSTFLNGFLASAGIYSQYQHLYYIPLVYDFSFGPLFYLFVKSKTEQSFRFTKREWLHFIPAILQAGFYFTIGFRSAEYKSMIWRELYGPYLQYVDEGGFLVITLIYLTLAGGLVKSASKEAWREPVLKWIQRFIRYFFLLVAIIAIYTAAEWIMWLGFEINIYNIPLLDLPLNLATIAIALWLGINSWLYSHQSLLVERKITPQSLSDSLETEIGKLFSEDQVFLNPDFNLDMLSKLTGRSRNELSAHFSGMGSSFNETINKLRVEAFLNLIQKRPDFSLEGAAYDVGFGSKSTFNRAFKKEKGVSPTTFLRGLSN